MGRDQLYSLSHSFALAPPRNAVRFGDENNKAPVFKGKNGRPPELTLDNHAELFGIVADGCFRERTVDFEARVSTMVLENRKKRGINSGTVHKPSKRFFKRLDEVLLIKEANGEATTDARALATSSVRNAVAFAAMNELVVPLCTPVLILNVDATQFTVGADDNGKILVKYFERVPGKPLKVLPRKGDGGLFYTIKYYCLVSAMGYASFPVFVIANKSMDEHAIDVHRVEGLGIGTSVNEHGYVIFCKSRLGNRAFFDWFILILLIPWVKDLRRQWGLVLSHRAGSSWMVSPCRC
jgi:hypothetical protein